MVKLTHEIGISVSAGAAVPLYCRDSSQPAARVDTDAFSDYQSGSIFLPADGTPQHLSLGNIVDARGYYFEVHGTASVRLWLNKEVNGDPTTVGYLLLRPSNAADPDAAAIFTYQDAAIESLDISSPDGVPLTGSYVVWGYSVAQDGP